jgi:hypothetical protein
VLWSVWRETNKKLSQSSLDNIERLSSVFSFIFPLLCWWKWKHVIFFSLLKFLINLVVTLLNYNVLFKISSSCISSQKQVKRKSKHLTWHYLIYLQNLLIIKAMKLLIDACISNYKNRSVNIFKLKLWYCCLCQMLID